MNNVTTMIWARVVAFAMILVLLGIVFFYMVLDMNPKGNVPTIKGYIPWEKETIQLAETWPMQDGGRIKPLSTHAAFMLLRMRGERSMKIQLDDQKTYKIKPTEWMMDCLFRPKIAVMLPTFRVDHSDAIKAIGLEPEEKRDRYSYDQLKSARSKLFELAQSYDKIEAKKRDAVQTQMINLAYNIRGFESLVGYFSFARAGIEMKGANSDGSSRYSDMSAVLSMGSMIQTMIQESQASGKEIPNNLKELLQQVIDGANYAKFSIICIPPSKLENKEWRSVGDSMMDVMTGKIEDPKPIINDVTLMEIAARSATEKGSEFRNVLKPVIASTIKRAEERSEYRSVPIEISYNKNNYMVTSLVFFLLGLLSIGAMWVSIGLGLPNFLTKITHWTTTLSVITGTILLTIAIVTRCIIMNRPPVGNLYDTIIFIGASISWFLLLIEWMNKQKIALTIAPILGLGLILLARRFEVGDASDHMDPLVAVLNSNYWLSTHVICVTAGYAAGLLTAILSVVYILLRGLGLSGDMKKTLKSLTTVAYGCLCLTLFLSLVGTVLGGIWANDSWGRFWGWDPKENGALMIVLWSLIMLHARLGGYIKEWGFHLASLIMACIVSFSWWHVNFLGVGLHNYGFTSGKMTIWLFYTVMLFIFLFGTTMCLVEIMKQNQGDKKITPSI
jgi:ABC-type transport system involved in cytochrome c biogenesis permease subunit